MSQNKPKDWKMSDRERKESKRINLLFNANHSKAKHSEMVRRELKTLKKGGVDRMAEAFAVADSKAIQLHELLVRLVAMTNDPSKRHLQARIIGFDRQMREGAFEDLSFIQEAFLMGAEVGADADLRKVVEQTSPEAQRENARKGNNLAIRERQKQKADRRKENASADRKWAATDMMFELVDEAAPDKRMKQIPASDHVWKKLFSHLKDLKIKPGTIRRWYAEEKRRRLKRARRKTT